MNNEEKAIEVLKTVIETRKFSGIYTSIDIICEAIETILKLYEDKKEEIYAIAKTNYDIGVLDERNEWYKKINEMFKYKEKLALQIYNTTILKNRTKKEDEEVARLEIEMRLLKQILENNIDKENV